MLKYEITNRAGGAVDCFPEGFDRGDLANITTVADRYAKYINLRTGEIIDCAVFAEQAFALQAGGD